MLIALKKKNLLEDPALLPKLYKFWSIFYLRLKKNSHITIPRFTASLTKLLKNLSVAKDMVKINEVIGDGIQLLDKLTKYKNRFHFVDQLNHKKTQ